MGTHREPDKYDPNLVDIPDGEPVFFIKPHGEGLPISVAVEAVQRWCNAAAAANVMVEKIHHARRIAVEIRLWQGGKDEDMPRFILRAQDKLSAEVLEYIREELWKEPRTWTEGELEELAVVIASFRDWPTRKIPD